jgi:hypothetical protein
MKIEEKFNKRSAELLEVQKPVIHVGPNHSDEGIKVTFYQMSGEDGRTLAQHMKPDEALEYAQSLIAAALQARRFGR